MARELDVFGFGVTSKIIVPPGATLGVLVKGVQGQLSSILKYGSGGSLEIVGAPSPLDGYTFGSTWAGASLVNLQGSGYLMGTTEAIAIDGAAKYYLLALGATTTCFLLKGLSQGA